MFLIALLSIFSLGQLARISLVDGQINFYLYELILLGTLFYFFIKKGFNPISDGYKNFKYIFWFLGSLLLSLIISISFFNFSQNMIAFLYLLRISFYFVLFVYVRDSIFIKRKKDHERSIMIFSAITITGAIFQYFFYPNLRNLFYLGWDPHEFRVFGFFLEPAVIAAVFGLLLIYFFDKKRTSINKLILAVITFLSLLTYSRGFFISLIFTGIIYFFKNKLYKFLVVFLLISIVSIFLISSSKGEGVNLERTTSVQDRLIDYREGVRVWMKNPIFGVGYNHIPFVKNIRKTDKSIPNHGDSAFHSSFLTILSSAGPLGLAAFIFMLYKFTLINERAFYLTIFLGAFSFFDNILLQPFILFFYLYLLLGEISFSRKLQ